MNKVEHYYKMARYEALMVVKCMARKILAEHTELDEFVMAMGSYFFTYKNSKERLAPFTEKYIASNHSYILEHSEPFLKELNDFISEWNSYLKITGEPMRFTDYGEIVTDW